MLHCVAAARATTRAFPRVVLLESEERDVAATLLGERDAEEAIAEGETRNNRCGGLLLSSFRKKNDPDDVERRRQLLPHNSSLLVVQTLFPTMRACLFRLQQSRLVLRLQLLSRHHSATQAKGIASSRALMTTLTTTASASASASASPASAAAAATPPAPQTKSRKPQPPPPTPTIIHRPPIDPSLLPVPGEPLCRAALRVLNAPTADLKARLGAEAARMWFAGSLEPPSPENAGLDPPAPERPARDDDAVTIVHPQKVKRLKAGGESVREERVKEERRKFLFFRSKIKGKKNSSFFTSNSFQKNTGTLSSRLAILHALCHIESWAIDLVSCFLFFSFFLEGGWGKVFFEVERLLTQI